MARSSERSDRFSDESMDKYKKGDKTALQVVESEKKIGQRLIDIRKQLEDATDLSSKERIELQRRISDLRRGMNPEEIAKLEEEVKGTIHETQETTRSYFSQLEQNQELFGIDTKTKSGNQAPSVLEKRKQEFIEDTLEGKKTRLTKLDEEIRQMQEMRDQLIRIVGQSPAHLKAIQEKEITDRLPYIEQLEQNLKKFKEFAKEGIKNEVYSEKDIEHDEKAFRDKPVEEQEKILTKMQKEVSKKNIDSSFAGNRKKYEEFSQKRRSEFSGEWKEAKTEKEQNKILEKMRAQLKKDFVQKCINSDKATKYYSRTEKENFTKLIQDENFNTKAAEDTLEKFNEWVKIPEEYGKAYEKASPLVQALYKDFWNLTVDKKGEVMKEIKEHEKLGEKWNIMLEQAEKKNLICHTSAEDYKQRFVGLELRDKKRIIEGQNTLQDPRRTQNLREFKSLPRTLQKKHEIFYGLRLEERMRLVQKLHEELKLKREIKGKLHKKVEEMLRGKLLAKKSVEGKNGYHEWIDQIDDLNELKKMLEDSDLDSPQRKHVLETFQNLPKELQRKHAEFYGEDLSGRILLLREITPDKGASLAKELSSLEKAKTEVKNFQAKMQNVQLREVAERFEKNGNLGAEEEIRKMLAEKDPDDMENAKRLEQIQILRGERPDVIAAIQSAKEDAALKNDLDALQIENTYANIIRLDEIRQNQAKGLRARNQKHENEDISRLEGQLFEETKGEMIVDKRSGKAIKTRRLKMADLKKNDHSFAQNQKLMFEQEERARFAERKDAEMQRFTVQDEKGEELSGTRLEEHQSQDNRRVAKKIIKRMSAKTKLKPETEKELQKALEEELGSQTLINTQGA